MAKNNTKNANGLIKRFVGNKNTVTVLGILACILTLVIGYNVRVSKAIDPIQIPYAKVSIPARTLVTSSMVGRIKVASTYVNEAQNLIKNTQEVVGKYASYKSAIPKGSLFYKNSLKSPEEMPDAAFANIEEGFTIFSLEVDKDTTYANSIRAGDYIDLYMSTESDETTDKLVMFGCLIKSIRVLAVKDSKGENILKNSLSYGEPAELLFAVDDELFELLMESKWVPNSVELIPVIYNENYTNNAGQTNISSDELKEFIKAQTKSFAE